MANVKILDTGYIKNSTLGGQTQLSVANRAGWDGASTIYSFTLNVTSLRLAGGAKTENKPVVGTLDDVDTSVVSSRNRMIQVSITLTKVDQAGNYQYNELFELVRLERTKGLKLIYVDGTSDNLKTIVEFLGEENVGGVFSSGSPSETNGTVSSTTPYLVGRIKNFNVSDSSAEDKYRITFDFELSQ